MLAFKESTKLQESMLFSKILKDIVKNLRLWKTLYASLASTVGRYVTEAVKTH